MSQTSVQNAKTIRFGSAKLEIGEDLDHLTDIGALTEVHFTHDIGDKVSISSDNAGIIIERAGTQTATIAANMMEINLDNLAIYMSGVSEMTVEKGDSETFENEEHTLTGTTMVRLNNKNADGSRVTISSVTAGGETAEEGTDYNIAIDDNGYTCIARIDGSEKISDGGIVKVTYTAVPASCKKLGFGGLQTLDANVARLTNYDSDGNEFRITVYKATADQGIEIEFQADDADETNVIPISMTGTEDTTRAAGDQLFVIEDFQDA